MTLTDDNEEDKEPHIEKLMHEIRSQVSQYRIRLKEFFSDYDKLRHGEITLNKFRAGLSMANIKLKEKELELLEDYFKVNGPDHPRLVSYLDFINNGKCFLCSAIYFEQWILYLQSLV